MHAFELEPDATIGDVAALVRDAEGLDASVVRVRLISGGKLLRDHSTLLSSVAADGSFLHCAVSDALPPPPPPPPRAGRSVRAAAGRGVGEVRIVIPSLTPRGFDRLTQAGFTEEEVAAMRRQFRTRRRESGGDEVDDVESEEAWLSSSGADDDYHSADHPDDAAAGSSADRRARRAHSDSRFILGAGVEGTSTDFLMGCVCGYLLGVLVLALLLDKNITRRWRVGIVVGCATNAAFGILRTSLYAPLSTT